MTITERNLVRYMTRENALDYVKSSNDIEKEKLNIARHLCGDANKDLALYYMYGDTALEKEFFDNVFFNGEASNPYILRAINLHLLAISKVES